MRKYLKTLVLLLSAMLLLSGCRGKKFGIEFLLPADCNTTVRMLYYASDKQKGWIMETVASVQGGKAKAECATINPTVVYVIDHSQRPVIAFYAERGDNIKIESAEEDPLSWKITGNTLSERWSEWRIANIEALRSRMPDRINKAVADYVTKNPEEKLSMVLMLTSYDRAADPAGYERLWKSLKEKALDTELLELIGRSDQAELDLIPHEKLTPLTLRTVNGSGGVDTIDPAKAEATMILFWHSSENSRRTAIDSLRRLVREFPDSSSRLIADICLDLDSTAWRIPLMSDSLRHTVRGWIPRGEADLAVSRLGVRATPMFIVTDSKGTQRYSGSDAGKASAEFRRLMKAAKPKTEPDKNKN